MRVLIGLILLCFAFLGGYSLGGGQGREDGYREGFDAAKAKVFAAGLIPPTPVLLSVSGPITAIEGDVISVEATQRLVNPFEDPLPTVRHAHVNAETKLIELVPKPPEELERDRTEFERAVRAYNAAIAAGRTDVPYPTLPVPVTEKPITLADLKVGDTVTVSASHDILRATTFEALEIRVTSDLALLEPTTPSPQQ